MSIAFPTTLDTLTNPTGADTLATGAVLHSTQHSDVNDAVEALEVKVGVNSSAVATTIDYLLKNTSSVDPGHHHTNASVDSLAVSKLTGGGYKITVVSKTTTYTALATDDLIRCSGTFTVTLPAATGTGKLLYIKNTGTGVVTVDADGAEVIDGQLTQIITVQYDSMLICDAASGIWNIL